MAHSRASRGARRRHEVILVPALQQVPGGRLRLVGLCRKNHKVVVRNLLRKVLLDATEQALSSRRRSSKHMRYRRACAKI